MVDLFKSLKANYTISAAVCALLGLVLVIWPGATSQIICMLLGGVLLAYGILQIAIYLFNRERTIILQGMMLLGIVFAVIGLWILLKPEMIIMAVPVIVGVLIVIHGLHNIIQALALKKDGYENWWLAFVLGMLTVIFGGVLICNPFKAIELVVRIIGVFLIYDGVSDIWILSRVFKVKRDKERIIDASFVDIEDED
ncbi:MAG: hypothetical protein HFI44_03055 [Lachnospiraceae bacterium]|nr:hypothetical protein [Lachnospiraceae bacterium]GFI03643.1 hypothetical protein IMSAGC005_02481 [Lachnospiraceae bacterium]